MFTRHLRLAAAQSGSLPGDIPGNVINHCRFIDRAAAAQVDVLVFPELSLCGYEPACLRACALHPDDPALAPIRERARTLDMTLVVGAPMPSPSAAPFIGAITFFPGGETAVYHKHWLHAGEEAFATPGASPSCVHRIHDEAFALAICADTAHEQHARDAAGAGAAHYLAGVLWTEGGYAAGARQAQGYAARYTMAVLVANHGGPSGGYESAGRSAFWAPGGALIAAADGPGDHLVIATRDARGWSGEVLSVP